MVKKQSAPPAPSGRGDATREKLLDASIGVFGRYGFDGASTRMLADAASVNLQAIPYYFGSKEGLYVATADHIASLISSHVGGLGGRIRARLAEATGGGTTIDRQEAQAFLTELAQAMAVLFIGPISEPLARFLIREQMEPTEAFERIFAQVMKPMLEAASMLVGIVLGEDGLTRHVKLRTLSLLGGLMVFRVAHAAVKRHLAWDTIGADEVETVRRHAGELVAALAAEGGRS
ncbi:CerR family C-terminal domain-containing protein [Labrys sp. KB_33_2]|uniref:CerR family C-terminal domain-containing protein n=1 Tax=Labrys sp. KB_33_2 TaxID=3237479 RepID=UPI003F929CE5